jgi:DNA-binding HxlR family transcriptional regulator
MNLAVNTEYCSFTKAVEHLGDRWSLLIVRELIMAGPLGFNALASAIPGHISRSVLADRLRRLRDLGLVSRTKDGTGGTTYQLAGAGRDLVPTILELRRWADGWLPDDPAVVERDPGIVFGWLAERVAVHALPERQVIVALTVRHTTDARSWIVLEQDSETYVCLEDPLLDEDRYVYVEAGASVLMALARGRRDWHEALADGSVEAFGDPELVARLPRWFQPVEAIERRPGEVAGARA